MSKPAAFQATYSDFKLVKTRKVAQLVFEVPLEAVDDALSVVGGMPDPGAERWFGIAPLKPRPVDSEITAKGKQSWRDMLPSAQAAIRCNDPLFWAYLGETYDNLISKKPTTADECAECVRSLCVVKSRSELNTNQKARVVWRGIDDSFQAWKTLEQAS